MQSLNSQIKKFFHAFIYWRLTHVSDRNFLLILSVVIGLASGLVAVLIKNSVHFVQWLLTFFFVPEYQNILLLFYPLAGLFIVFLLTKFVFRKKAQPEISDVLFAIHRKNGILPLSNTWITMITSAITVGFGGSVGLEGPSATSGAGMGSFIAKLFHLSKKQTILIVSCAGSAAIASLFKAPIAAVVFALEIFMLDLNLSSVLPLLISAVVGTITSYLFFGQDVLYDFRIISLPQWNELPFFIILGAFTGLFSIYFIRIKRWSSKLFNKFSSSLHKILFGGTIIGLMIFLMPALFGEGYRTVNSCLHGDYSFLFAKSPFYAYRENIYAVLIMFLALIVLKSFVTFFTIEAGGIGGIFAPILFLGSCIGFFVAIILNLIGIPVEASNFAMVAMAGMLSGVMFAPLTGIFLIAEVTHGYDLIIPLMIVSATSYAIVRSTFRYSIFMQHLAEKGILFGHHKGKNVVASMNVAQLIETNFLPIKPDNSLRDLISVIAKSKRNIYPVVDENNMLIGLVYLDHIKHIIFNDKFYDTMKVSDLYVMPENVIQLNDPMSKVMKIFQKTDAYNLPVVDRGKYVGFLSKATVMSAFQQKVYHQSDE
ncbi:MAG: chloride channel protein [Bacteroidales bacterium]|nr:chloride channel protein [Bacteroidales bacterium]